MQPTSSFCSDPIAATCNVLEAFFERLTCAAKSQTMDTLIATELTFSQMRSVFILGSHGSPMSVNELADALGLSLAATGRGVDKLVGMGIVDRREDSADRRIKRISLTDKGQGIVDTQLSIKEDLLRDFVTRLPADVRDRLRSALEPVVDGDNDYFPTSISEKVMP